VRTAAPELRQAAAELELLSGIGGGRRRDRQAEREHCQASSDALLDLLEVLDLEVVWVGVMSEQRERLAIEERQSGGSNELCGNVIAAGSLLR
jgi:hypothetical protein